MKKVIIYNPASIDSTISAAVISASEYGAVAYPAGNKIPLVADNFIWVGVEPKQESLKQYTGMHDGYYADDSGLTKITESFAEVHCGKDDLLSMSEAFTDCYGMLKASVLRTLIARDFHTHKGFESLWLFAALVQEFEQGSKLVSKLDQAMLWDNYNRALKSLTSGKPFTLDTLGGKDDVRQLLTSSLYDDFITDLKHQLGMIFETVRIAINGRSHNVPIINVNQSASPWLLRLISNSYDYAVTYEQRRGKSIYTTFSRLAGFDKAIMKELRGNSVQSDSACLSYQL